MGSVASMVGACGLSRLACCCGSSACSMCCSACPTSTSSTSSRIVYAVLLLLTSIVAWIMLAPDVSHRLRSMDKYTGTVSCSGTGEECDKEWGQLGVLRVMFANAMFFGAMALLMIGVKSSRDPRAGIQNGFWAFKVLILAGAITGTFFMHNDVLIGWGWVALVMAFVFMLIQLVLLIDFAHSWNESWLAKFEDGSRKHACGLVGATLFLYLVSFVVTVLLYVYYTHADGNACHENKFFITFNMLSGLILTFVSVHPRVKERLPTSGLLQSGVVVFYNTYLVWSAISGSTSPCSDVTGSSTATIVVGALLTFLAVCYSSLRTSSASQLGKLGMSEGSDDEVTSLIDDDVEAAYDDDDDDDRPRKKVIDNEKDGVKYSWMFLHLVFTLASGYLAMVLTDWAVVKDGHTATVHIGSGAASMWVKVASSWLCSLVYFWSLVAPLCFPDREFN
eukprot:m.478074 g.478074  ORF g.478074 m.478074 type:complete len:449 (-) comp21027_c0_seq1:321-1667(-)